MDPDVCQEFFGNAPVPCVLLGPDRRIREANAAFRRIYPDVPPGADFLDVALPGDRPHLKTALAKAAGGRSVEIELPRPPGPVVEWRFFPVEGGPVGGVGRPRGDDPDIAEQLARAKDELLRLRRQLDQIMVQLTQVPFTDALTGLWNRLRVLELVSVEWIRCERYRSLLSLLLVQILDLAGIRAEHGESMADNVVKTVADRIRGTLRGHDILGRHDDARFVLVATDDSDSARGSSGIGGARALAERVREAVTAEPVHVGQKEIRVRVSIGGATNRSAGVEMLEDLAEGAEAALQEAIRGPGDIVIAPPDEEGAEDTGGEEA